MIYKATGSKFVHKISFAKKSSCTLVLIARFRAGLVGLNLSYPCPENPAKLGSSIFLYGFELG